MKNKKITFTTVLLMTGLSFASANDNIVSISITIENSKIENVRKVGYELCAFVKKDKGYFQKIKNFVFGMEPETAVAMKLNEFCMNNEHELEAILSYKPSDNKIIKELQERWFDFLSEDLLSLANNYVRDILRLVKKDNLIHSEIHNKTIEYFEKFNVYFELINALGIDEERRDDLDDKIAFILNKLNTDDKIAFILNKLNTDDKIAFILNKLKTLTKEEL